MRQSWRLRAGALVALGVVGVHEARYLWGESDTGRALAEPVHGYVEFAPWAVGLLVVALTVEFIVALARALGGAASRRRASFTTLWVGASVALLVSHFAQEAVEHLVAGHAATPLVDHVFGGAAWLPALISPALGALIAVALRGADAALCAVARRSRSAGVRRAPLAALRGPAELARPRVSVMALSLAGRAPPA